MTGMPTSHQGPLLTTKLMRPPAPPEVVPRPRPLAQLDRSARGRITLITAAAGYGKTTLLSQWLAGRRGPVAWLSLDGPDDSPARFWSYLLRALEGLIADDQDDLSELLKGLAAETAGEAELTRLVNAAGQLPRASLLVLDDPRGDHRPRHPSGYVVPGGAPAGQLTC